MACTLIHVSESETVAAPGSGEPVRVGAFIRAARAVAGLSQRELATRLGRSKSAIGRLERDDCGERTSVRAFAEALAACGLNLVVEGDRGRLLPDADPERDHAGRRYPAHLDPYPPMCRDDWWAPRFLYQCYLDTDIPWPMRTFALDRQRRDRRRRQLDYPHDARFWQGDAHLAPPFAVHPALLRQQEMLRRMGYLPYLAPRPGREWRRARGGGTGRWGW